MNEMMAETENDLWARQSQVDAEECGGAWGCGEALDGESGEFVVATEAQFVVATDGKETPGPVKVLTAVMHAQCGIDAGLELA